MRREHTIQGGLPSGYIQLEYIEGTGTQYIDTGFKPNQNSYFELDFQVTYNTTRYDFFTVVLWDSNGFGIVDGSMNNYKINTMYGTDQSLYNVIPNNQSFLIKRHVAIIDGVGKRTSIDTYNVTLPSQIFQSPYDLYLLGRNNNGTYDSTPGFGKIKVFHNILKDNTTLIRDYIPVLRTSDNKPGLYDLCGSICLLTNTPFYVNAGTGEFLYA